MSRFFTGSTGKVVCEGQTLKVKGWEIDPGSDLQENTHSGTAGYKTFNAGNLGLTGTITMEWDAEDNPVDDPPNLVPGADVALELYLEDQAGFMWDIPSALIRNTPVAVRNGANVTITANFVSNGSWTPPVGDFP